MPVYSIDPYPLRAGRLYSTDTFVTVWNVVGSNQITLPLVSNGTYNFYVDWGDGTKNTITTYNQAEVTHTYNYSGIYTVMITGTLTGFRFASGGDCTRLLRILNWGKNFCWGNNTSIFYGCGNLVITALDAVNLTGVTSFSNLFAYTNNITSVPNMGNWNISAITNLSSTFSNCLKFNQDLSKWNTANVTNMRGLFSNTMFNHDISNWDTSKVTDMSSMFNTDTAFNQDISAWDTSKVTDMSRMFYQAFNFNQNLGSWNISSLTDATYMFWGKALSTDNYDALLIGWAAQAPNIQSGVPFHGGNSKYSDAAVAARSLLVNTYGWTITDGGHV